MQKKVFVLCFDCIIYPTGLAVEKTCVPATLSSICLDLPIRCGYKSIPCTSRNETRRKRRALDSNSWGVCFHIVSHARRFLFGRACVVEIKIPSHWNDIVEKLKKLLPSLSLSLSSFVELLHINNKEKRELGAYILIINSIQTKSKQDKIRNVFVVRLFADVT